MIWTDERGASLLTRRLKKGTFERFYAHDDCRQRRFTRQELLQFLDGYRLK